MTNLMVGRKMFCKPHIQWARMEDELVQIYRPGRRDFVEGPEAKRFFEKLVQSEGFVLCDVNTVIQLSHVQGVDSIGEAFTVLFDRAECVTHTNPLSSKTLMKKATKKKATKKKATKKKATKKKATKKKATKKKATKKKSTKKKATKN